MTIKLSEHKQIKLKPYMRMMSGDVDTPVTLYQKYVGEKIGFLLESNEHPKGRYSFLGTDPYLMIQGSGRQVAVEIRNGDKEIIEGNPLNITKTYLNQFEVENETALPFVGGAVGTVGYDMIRQYESIGDTNEDTIGVPDLHQLFVKELIAYDHETNLIYLIALEEDSMEGKRKGEVIMDKMQRLLERNYTPLPIPENKSEGIEFRSHMDRDAFEAAVRRAKEYIYEGDIFQVVLSRRWSGKTGERPFDTYRKLRQINPSPYMFFMNFGSYQVAGSSPEMLVELVGSRIRNCPIAGTIGRGKNSDEDEVLANELLEDEKERAEHTMLVDLGRNDMGKVSEIGTVNVKTFMEVHKYSHVMHLVSLLEGKKAQGMDMFQVLMSFLPAGTLSGAPKIRAMQIIDELEEEKRGIYGGAIGYFGFNEHMDMCIAIRTMIMRDGIIYLQAGAGIVADSDESKEYEETEKKVRGLMVAIGKENRYDCTH